MSTTQPAHNPYLPVKQEWLDLHHEPIMEPDLPIVDPHHHLWDRPDWRYMPQDLIADVYSGHNVIATVYVQARAFHRAGGPEDLRPVGETEFVNGTAAMGASGVYGKSLLCAGIVGHANLTLGDKVDRVLEAHIRAGGDRFRGIRHIVAWDGDASLLNPSNAAPPGLLADAAESFAANMVDKLAPNHARIAENLARSLMLVTALNPRIGYDKAVAIGKKALAEDLTLRDAAAQLGYVTPEEFDRWVRPEEMVHPGASLGE